MKEVASIARRYFSVMMHNTILTPHEIVDSPEAKPSMPSIKFIAFVTYTMNKTVSTYPIGEMLYIENIVHIGYPQTTHAKQES